jgi:ribosomal protein L23
MNPVRSKKSKQTIEPAKTMRTSGVMNHMHLKPRISEKAYALSESGNTYIFDVPTNANKHDIAKSVNDQYEVKVTGVRISAVPGKAVRSYRKRGRKSINGQRSNIRKAYVTLS